RLRPARRACRRRRLERDRRRTRPVHAGDLVTRRQGTRTVPARPGGRRVGDRLVTTRTDAYDVIRRDVLTGIERRRLQPEAQVGEVRAEIERAVDDYQRRARLGDEVPLGDPEEMARRVLRSIVELGPLSELLARRDVEEVFVEGARVTFLDADG